MEWADEKLRVLDAKTGWDADSAWERLQAMRRTQHRRTVLAGGATAAMALAAAFPPSRAAAKRCVDACGELLGLTPATTLDDLRSVDLAALRGQVVLLNFWATWCPPCEAEIPWFVEMQAAFGGQGLAVVGVCMDAPANHVPAFLSRHRVNYRVVYDSTFPGVKSLPTTFLLDRAARVAHVHQGLAAKEVYRRQITALLAAK